MSSTYLADFNEMMLKKHNEYRALHGAPAMVIDEAAAKAA